MGNTFLGNKVKDYFYGYVLFCLGGRQDISYLCLTVTIADTNNEGDLKKNIGITGLFRQCLFLLNLFFSVFQTKKN